MKKLKWVHREGKLTARRYKGGCYHILFTVTGYLKGAVTYRLYHNNTFSGSRETLEEVVEMAEKSEAGDIEFDLRKGTAKKVAQKAFKDFIKKQNNEGEE